MHPEPRSSNTPGRSRDLGELKSLLRERAASMVATVILVEGTAELADSATPHARPVESGLRIASQTTLRVRSGRVMVRMDDGSDVWLAAGAELDFSPWSQAARRLRLVVGRALALVAHEAKRSFLMQCPAGSILVTGTAFEADASSVGLAVSVLHGSVEVSSDGGRVRARQGQAASVRVGIPPSVGRAGGNAGSWIGSAGASASNTRVAPAYRAVAAKVERGAGHTKEKMSMKNNSTGLVVAGIVLALIAGAVGVAVMASRDNAPATAAVPADAKKFDVALNPPKTIGGEARKAKIRLRGADGNDIEFEFDPSAPASEVDAKIASLPADQQETVRKAVEGIKAHGGGKFSFAASGDKGPGDSMFKGGENLVSREASASADAMKQLIAQGMSPEEASRVVSQALSDSLQKQMNDPNAKVRAVVSNGAPEGTTLTGPDGNPITVPEGATMLMIGVESTSGGEGSNELEVNVGGNP